MSDEIAKIAQPAPYIIKLSSDEGEQFFLIAESVIYMEVKSFPVALLLLFALFYVFDISYPKCLYPVYFHSKICFLYC